MSPWWIAAIVAACVIVLVIVCIFGMFLCRPAPGWNADRGGTVSAREVCFDAERWLACCVVMHWPRKEQPYRSRRQRRVYSGSIDRPIPSGINALQLPSSLRQPHSGTSSSVSYSPFPPPITSFSSDSPLCTSITPSLFHSRLKTYLIHKSSPPRSFSSSSRTAFMDLCLDRFF